MQTSASSWDATIATRSRSGTQTALKLVREHKSIEAILENLNRDKYGVPENWTPNEPRKRQKTNNDDEGYDTDQENVKEEEDVGDEKAEPVYVQARRLFNEHEVHTKVTLSGNPARRSRSPSFWWTKWFQPRSDQARY